MSRRKWLAAAIIGMSLLAPPTSATAASATAPSDAPDATLHVLAVNGSGCLPGSSTVENMPDGTGFTLHYTDFSVYGGQYKSCVVTMHVDAPAGWTFAIDEVQNAGYGLLDSGASGRLTTVWWFTGFPWTLRDGRTFTGSLDDFWRTSSDTVMPTYAPCEASFDLTLANTLRVTGPSTSVMEMFETSVPRLLWRRC